MLVAVRHGCRGSRDFGGGAGDSPGALRLVAEMTSPAAPPPHDDRARAGARLGGRRLRPAGRHARPGDCEHEADALSRLRENGAPPAWQSRSRRASQACRGRPTWSAMHCWRSATKATFHAQGIRGGCAFVGGLVSGVWVGLVGLARPRTPRAWSRLTPSACVVERVCLQGR